VDWEIREENLDLSSFGLEYRTAGGDQWIPLPVTGGTTGQRSWNPGASGAVEVRLRVRDLAKNEGEDKLTIMPGGQENRQPQNSVDSGGASPSTQPGVSYVNSKQIKLNYKITEEGKSGISAVELWVTRDGRTWAMLDQKSDNPTPPYIYTVADDGLYGFTILPRSGVGFKDREPRTGDQPHIWVEVDVTRPEISWLNADVGRGQDLGKLFITWKATDKNLDREPVKLYYAENIGGQWIPITQSSSLPNTGRYDWTMPPNVPVKFFVRIEVTDKAKNVATLDTTKPAIVDLKIPKGLILDAQSVGRP
jgi:hypothetical protein